MNLLRHFRLGNGVLVFRGHTVYIILRLAIFLLCAMLSLYVSAYEVTHAASFKVDQANPYDNEFNVDTPPSGYCAETKRCKLSFRIPIKFNSNSPIEALHNDYRQGATFKVPANWRRFFLTHAASGETQSVDIRITGIGATYELSNSVYQLTGVNVLDHSLLWSNSTFLNPPAPCRTANFAGAGSRIFGFFWFTPIEAHCSKRASVRIPGLKYQYLDVAYELVTPDPLSMRDGLYTGSFVYGVGPLKDFDMGDIMLPDDDQIVFNFKLNVQHLLKIDIPHGGNRVELIPVGGWQKWVNGGRKPQRLFRDQIFNISSSAKFKMQLECPAGQVGDTCALRNNAGDQVPLDVSVSLPFGFSGANGSVVNRLPLRIGVSEIFQSSYYVDRKPAILHFEVKQQGVDDMLRTAVLTWYGTVSVIWDSEI